MSGSAGGVFKLIANDGKADRMIMATELLNRRIKEITCMRAQMGQPDPTPTLVDIEKTHILFVNAHFKPFAAIGYEYNKVKSASGQIQFGGSVTYSIPQFGDFFHDMVVNVKLASVSASQWAAGDVPAFPTAVTANAIVITNGAGSEADLGTTYATYVYQYVLPDGTVIDRTTYTGSNFVRYCEYPGQRLFKSVKFEVNGNPLDEYTSNVTVFHQKFRVSASKLTGWKRLVGQEVPIEGYTDLCTIAGISPWPSTVLGLQNTTPAAATLAPVADPSTARKLGRVVNGPQTPKATQPALDMWIPLLFWFNRDARLSIASVSIPYGQRFVTIDLEQQDRLVFTAPGSLRLRLTVETFDNADGTSAGDAITAHRCYVLERPVLVPTSVVNTSQSIEEMSLYINNIFVNPEVHDIYIRRIGFSLIRVHRFQTITIQSASGESQLTQLKWPIETIFAGMRPSFNTKKAVYSGLTVQSGNKNEWRDWHRMTRLVDRQCYSLCRSSSLLATGNADGTLLTPAGFLNGAFRSECLSECDSLTYPESRDTLTTVAIVAHGVNIYAPLKTAFFTDYQPYHYGGSNITTPEDEGALMINFCLYPGTYQPSGHVNVSRAREFFLCYTSAFTGAADTDDPSSPAVAEAQLLIVASAINFLLISDGSAVLRYTT